MDVLLSNRHLHLGCPCKQTLRIINPHAPLSHPDTHTLGLKKRMCAASLDYWMAFLHST